MAGGIGGFLPRTKEKSRGGYRPAADGRYLAPANRPYYHPRTGAHPDRGLSHFRSDPKTQVLTWASAPNPGSGGTAASWRLQNRPLVKGETDNRTRLKR